MFEYSTEKAEEIYLITQIICVILRIIIKIKSVK